jgi:antitoxin HicB
VRPAGRGGGPAGRVICFMRQFLNEFELRPTTEVLCNTGGDEQPIQALACPARLHVRAGTRRPPQGSPGKALLGAPNARQRETARDWADPEDHERSRPQVKAPDCGKLTNMGFDNPLEYRAVVESDDNGTVLVSFPDFPEAHTFGETQEEALAHAPDALATAIDGYIKSRRRLPAPSGGSGPRVIVPALTAAKMALHSKLLQQNVTKSELARRLQVHPPQVDRLLDVRHASRLDMLERAFQALGTRLVLAFRPVRARVRRGPDTSGVHTRGAVLSIRHRTTGGALRHGMSARARGPRSPQHAAKRSARKK